MRRLVRNTTLLLIMGIATRPVWSQSPCDNVDRSFTDNSKVALAPVIARQLRAKKVDVLQSFRFDGWTILYVNSYDSDETFLFYQHDPLHTRYITMWGGAAASNEEQSIKNWTLKNAPVSPPKLASCLAGHVTNDRDR